MKTMKVKVRLFGGSLKWGFDGIHDVCPTKIPLTTSPTTSSRPEKDVRCSPETGRESRKQLVCVSGVVMGERHRAWTQTRVCTLVPFFTTQMTFRRDSHSWSVRLLICKISNIQSFCINSLCGQCCEYQHRTR